MLTWVVVILLIAILAAIFGFGGITAAVFGIYRALSSICLVIIFLLLVSGLHGTHSELPLDE